jgi:hypothetical protein
MTDHFSNPEQRRIKLQKRNAKGKKGLWGELSPFYKIVRNGIEKSARK